MQAIDEIYQKYAHTVYRYLLSHTHDANLAEELTQETFYQAIRSSGRYDETCKITTWLCGIARNVYLSWQRKHPFTEDIEEQNVTVSSAEDDALKEEERLDLFKRLHRLKEPYREVLYLRVFGGLSFREIAQILDKSENWARVTFYRGKENLKKEMTNDE